MFPFAGSRERSETIYRDGKKEHRVYLEDRDGNSQLLNETETENETESGSAWSHVGAELGDRTPNSDRDLDRYDRDLDLEGPAQAQAQERGRTRTRANPNRRPNPNWDSHTQRLFDKFFG